jgi:hypothetical protein
MNAREYGFVDDAIDYECYSKLYPSIADCSESIPPRTRSQANHCGDKVILAFLHENLSLATTSLDPLLLKHHLE